MLKKMIFGVITAVIVILGVWTSVFAEVNIDSPVADATGVTVNGRITTGGAGKVNLIVVRENGRGDSFWQAVTSEQIIEKTEQVKNDIYYIGTVNTIADGSFSMRINLDVINAPGSEIYRVICRQQGAAASPAKSSLFYLPSNEDIRIAVDKINSSDLTELKRILAVDFVPDLPAGEIPYISILQLDIKGYFDMLTDKTAVYNSLLNKGFTTREAIQTAFNNAVSTAAISELGIGKVNPETANIGVLDASIILGKIGASYSDGDNYKCDFNSDKIIDMADVDAVIRYILENGPKNPSAAAPSPAEAKLQMNSLSQGAGTIGNIKVSLSEPQKVVGLQFDIEYNPAIFEIFDTVTFDNSLKDYRKEYKIIKEDGKNTIVRFVVVAPNPSAPVVLSNLVSFRVSSFQNTAGGEYKINFVTGSSQLHNVKDAAKPVPVLYVDSAITLSQIGGNPSNNGTSSYMGGGGGGGFVNPNPAPVVTPSPIPQPETGGFKDLGNVGWASEAINYLSDNKIVNGVSPTEFEPSRNITRAEFLKILLEALDLVGDGSGEAFTDVSPSDWFYKYAVSAKAAGISVGDDTGAFNPNALITREDMAVLCMRAINVAGKELLEINPLAEFKDSDQFSGYAAEDIAKMQMAGIINGRDGNIFAPKDNATRAEACVMLYRLIK